MKVPRLKLTGVAAATTYKFRGLGPLEGWACCTVNDETRELLITSDWGDWSYNWGSPSFGQASDLTEFISTCSKDYLSRKLYGGQAKEFDGAATTKVIKAHLKTLRKSFDISKDTYKSSISELERVREYEHIETLYMDRLNDICDDKGNQLLDEPWYFVQKKDSSQFLILQNSIIPALKLACGKASTQRKKMKAVIPEEQPIG